MKKLIIGAAIALTALSSFCQGVRQNMWDTNTGYGPFLSPPVAGSFMHISSVDGATPIFSKIWLFQTIGGQPTLVATNPSAQIAVTGSNSLGSVYATSLTALGASMNINVQAGTITSAANTMNPNGFTTAGGALDPSGFTGNGSRLSGVGPYFLTSTMSNNIYASPNATIATGATTFFTNSTGASLFLYFSGIGLSGVGLCATNGGVTSQFVLWSATTNGYAVLRNGASASFTNGGTAGFYRFEPLF